MQKNRAVLFSLCLAGLCMGLLLVWLGCRPFSPSAEPSELSRIKQQKVLRVGVQFNMRPFSFVTQTRTNQAQFNGFEVDLTRALAKRLLGSEEAVSFRQVVSATRMIALTSHQVDMVIATMTITPDRARLIDFSEVYYTAGQGLLVPRQSPIKTPQDLQTQNLQPQRILYVKGTTSELVVKKRFPHAQFVGYNTLHQAFEALKAKQGDVLTNDDGLLLGLDDSGAFRLLDERLNLEPYGIGFYKSPTGQPNDLRAWVNAQLSQMKADGTLDALIAKWHLGRT